MPVLERTFDKDLAEIKNAKPGTLTYRIVKNSVYLISQKSEERSSSNKILKLAQKRLSTLVRNSFRCEDSIEACLRDYLKTSNLKISEAMEGIIYDISYKNHV